MGSVTASSRIDGRGWLARLRSSVSPDPGAAREPSRRFGLLALLALALGAYVVFVQPTGPALVVEGGHRILVSEFAAGVPVGQEFVPVADHLNAVRVVLRAEQPVDAEVRSTLFSVSDGELVPIYSWSQTVSVDGRLPHTFRFPSVVQAAGRRFRFELRLARPVEGLALEARSDDALRPGFLTVDGEERWGDLVFRATPSTLYQVLSVTPRRLPRLLRQPIVLLTLLLLQASAVAFFWTGLVPPAEGGWRSLIADGATVVRRPAVLVGVVLLVAGTLVYRYRSVELPASTVNLIDRFDDARKTSDLPLERAFEIAEITIGDRRLRIIGAHPTSRIAWRVRVPEDGWLRVSAALKPDAWGMGGDGVLFRVGVADGDRIEVLAGRHVDPSHNPADRAWIPMLVDLSPFAGQELEVMLGTDPGVDGSVDSRFDWAVWGEPEIVVDPRAP